MDAFEHESISSDTRFNILKQYLEGFTLAELDEIRDDYHEDDVMCFVPSNLRPLLRLFLIRVNKINKPSPAQRDNKQYPTEIIVVNNQIRLSNLVCGIAHDSWPMDEKLSIRCVAKLVMCGSPGVYDELVLNLSKNMLEDCDIPVISHLAKQLMTGMTKRLTIDLSRNQLMGYKRTVYGVCDNVEVSNGITELLNHEHLEFLDVTDNIFAALENVTFYSRLSAENLGKLIWISECELHQRGDSGDWQWKCMLANRTDDIESLAKNVLALHEAYYCLAKQRNAIQ